MELEHVIRVARYAKKNGGTGVLSTGESLTAALVLNRADWLKEMNYTIPEAINRIDRDTVYHLRDAELIIEDEGDGQ